MRTLKKSLALVLALVMVLGLGVIGASADNALDNYTDASEIGDAYYEAVGVLTGLGIIDGMTETTIEPTGTYTREQAAKIIATMVLGVKNAESLTCVEAPFDDVPADRWSAGYIAFCVEQGIIDGMTDTTFEPTGTLTGFQWAKMLLAAVGFGANGEFTGTSWSLNTARVAHEAGLFTGDLSGADHVNLSRQQAALYAFNTLTAIKQVSYSANNDNYIYGLQGYDFVRDHVGGSWWADGTGFTLGESVFDLTYAYGVISDNEGNGNDSTVLANVTLPSGDEPSSNLEVSADTDIYMMWHAVKQWYVDDKANTGVFTLDLADVVSADCADVAKKDYPEDLDVYSTEKVVGDKGDKQYEQYVIDNRAYENAFAEGYVVNYMFRLDELGPRSESNDTTVIGNVPVKNDKIFTDISEISRKSDIIVLETEHGAYYVYALGATSGNIEGLAKDGTITLTDGTELAQSALATVTQQTLDYIEWILSADKHSTPAFSFTLDTHGHYIDLSDSAYKTVAYFTDAWKITNPGAWNTDVEYIAQFVDVASGDVEEVPVTADWKAWAQTGNYYDITDELYGDATYEPHRVFVRDDSYGEYRHVGSQTFSTKDIVSGDILYNVSDVTFIIASGAGDDIDVNTYEGVEALLDAYDYDYSVNNITLKDICVVVSESSWGNEYATVVFAYDAGAVTGGYVFFPEDMTAEEDWDKVTDSFYQYNVAYLNGSVEGKVFKVARNNVNIMNLKAGFYTYEIDANTGYAINLKRVTTEYTVDVSTSFRGDANETWIGGHKVADDVVIADVREDVDPPIDDIEELAEFWNDYADHPDHSVKIVYFLNGDGDVAVIYVVDVNDPAWQILVSVDTAEGYTGTVTASVDKTSVDPSDADKTVTVTLSKPEGDNWKAPKQTVEYTVNDKGFTEELTVTEDTNTATFEVTVTGDTTIVINNVTGSGDRSKSSRNLRIGGTDRREHKLIYQKKVERGKKE